MRQPDKIDYVELVAPDLGAVKAFFSEAFGWSFVDYGPAYVAFEGAGLDGGFRVGQPAGAGGALVILYSDSLEAALAAVESAGGEILQPIFAFPGGWRFHFADPGGNAWAVWSDVAPTAPPPDAAP
jgi:predicted enzyme related to lactoylglutathione lyase